LKAADECGSESKRGAMAAALSLAEAELVALRAENAALRNESKEDFKCESLLCLLSHAFSLPLALLFPYDLPFPPLFSVALFQAGENVVALSSRLADSNGRAAALRERMAGERAGAIAAMAAMAAELRAAVEAKAEAEAKVLILEDEISTATRGSSALAAGANRTFESRLIRSYGFCFLFIPAAFLISFSFHSYISYLLTLSLCPSSL